MAVSSTLICEEKKIQWSVYYTSQAFQGVEMKYLRIEKLAFALLIALRKLHPYFQTHANIVMMDQPSKNSMSKPDVARRMVQWAIELSQFDVKHKPKIVIKAQALTDFIVEFMLPG